MKRFVPAIVGVVVLVLVAGGLYVAFRPSDNSRTVTAHFSKTVSIYVGSSVRVLGVPIGKVTKLTNEGPTVRVEMQYDGSHKVPADAGAVIVPPAIVGDRYIQLSPAYTGGPVMRDGADIPQARTSVPLELDQIYQSLDNLDTALGPNGANKDGALSDAVDVGAANLAGNGKLLHDSIVGLSNLFTTLDNNKGDLVGTVDNLSAFTSTLVRDNSAVKAVNDDLATVAAQLNGERDDLAAALRNLSVALNEVADFVRSNRDAITGNVKALGDVTSTLVKQKAALSELLDDAPQGLLNLADVFNPEHATLDTRSNNGENDALVLSLCSLLQGLGQDPSTCPFAGLTLPSSGSSSASTSGRSGVSVPTGLGGLLGVRQ